MIDYKISQTDASGDASGYDFLTVDEIKTYLNVTDASGEDALLTDLRDAACGYAERQFKQSLKGNSVEIYFSGESYCDLMFRPVTSIDSVTYVASDDSSGTLSASGGEYSYYGQLGSRTSSVVLSTTASYKSVTATITSNGSSVPTEIKYAILAHIKVMYDNNRVFIGEDVPDIPPTETFMLMQPYKPVVI